MSESARAYLLLPGVGPQRAYQPSRSGINVLYAAFLSVQSKSRLAGQQSHVTLLVPIGYSVQTPSCTLEGGKLPMKCSGLRGLRWGCAVV